MKQWIPSTNRSRLCGDLQDVQLSSFVSLSLQTYLQSVLADWKDGSVVIVYV